MDAIQLQRLQILWGDRGPGADAAAKIKHLQALLSTIPSQPGAATATAAPTMEQYNQLLEDVRAIYSGLNALRVLLR